MLSRTALRRVVRPSGSLAPQAASVRQLSFAVRPSPIALGKRPAIPSSSSFAVASIGSSRNLSWTPWKSATPAPASAPAQVEEPVASTSALPPSHEPTAAPTPEPILTESHPDLNAAGDVSASTPPPIAEAVTPPFGLPLSPADAALLPQPPANDLTPSLEDLILHSGKPLEEVLASPEAVHAVMKVSDLKLMGYEHGFFSISGWFTDAIVGIHTHVGLPWWATIASITVAIRLCLSPLLVATQKHNVRLAAVNPQIQGFMAAAKEAQAKKDVHAQTVVGQAMRQLMKEHNVNPMRTLLLPAVQLPIFLTFFSIVRGLVNLPIPQLKEGGFGWVTDLTMADPYYILPVTSLLFTNLVFKFGADGMNTDQKSGSPMRAAHMRNAIQAMTAVSVFFVAWFPAAILFYWTFSSGFTLLQSMVLRIPAVKHVLGIPAPPVVPPPPGQAPFKNPSHLDTFRAIKEWFDGAAKQMSENQSERAALIAQQKRGSSVIARRADQFVERIKEDVPASAAGAAIKATPSSPAASSSASVQTPASAVSTKHLSPREAEKHRRIAAAREKRAKQ